MSTDRVILRVRKGVPGIGRMLGRELNLYEATCGNRPNERLIENGVVLNYGRSTIPSWDRPDIQYINHPNNVRNCVDKLACLKILDEKGIDTLIFTTDITRAYDWLENGEGVIVRHTLTGKQGNGVELVLGHDSVLPVAPLYTKFYNKTHEFRVHVVDGKVIDVTQKKRMGKKKLQARGLTEPNHVVRSRKRGWVFAHKDIYRFVHIDNLALDAVDALGLDYAGVDILADITNDGVLRSATVCEVNSAPGMSKQATKTAYIKAFSDLINRLRR